MSLRHDTDLLISTWVADSVGLGGPDYLSEVLAVVEHTPQRRWAKWFPGGWTVAPAKAPVVRSRMLLAAGALLLAALVAGALAAGAFRRPAFVLQGVVPLAGATDTPFLNASDDALWATVEGGVLAIDPATGKTTRFELPGAGPQLTGVVARPDVVWVADYFANRVVSVDRSTGQVASEVHVPTPGNLQWQDGLWAQGSAGGVVRISPATGAIDLRLPDAIAYAVAPGALWYLTLSNLEAAAIEIDPATGAEQRRVAVPAAAAGSISIDAAGNPWIFARGPDRTSVVKVDAATGIAGTPFELPYDAIGGLLPIGDTVWALPALDLADGARIVELGATGPTGRAESLQDGLDPDGPVVAFGSVWIPWDGHAALYRYPVDALAR